MRLKNASHLLRKLTLVAATAGAFLFPGAALRLEAQQPAIRIAGAIGTSSRVALKGTVSPHIHAQGAVDQGRVASNLPIQGLELAFAPSATQIADLKQLLADQQNPASPSYHQWLTPAQFAARFGMNDADIAKVQSWLSGQGFTVLGVNNSRTRITFNGTAGQVEAAFGTEMHHYLVGGETHLANATEVQVPGELAGVVSGLQNLTDFRLKPHHILAHRQAVTAGGPKPQYTDGSGYHDMAPADIVTIYDIQALYNQGYTGTGQKIAIVGQSAVSTSDIDAFRTAAGLPANDPTLVLVPNSGTSTVYSGDESESDLDLEWSGAIAQNASIYFVYVGSNTNVGVFNSLEYAIDNDTAPIISISYGECEPQSLSDPQTLEPVLMQANAQGQTVIASAGDTGATACDNGTNSNGTAITSATQGLAVDYPASSAYVTALGGTQFNDATGSYWNSTNGSGGGSAVSYIPEVAWNETAINNSGTTAYGLDSTGGGKSVLFGKPTWQVAAGVPSDGARDVPDISIDAANDNDPYLFCTSDTSAFSGPLGDNSSCNSFTYGGVNYSAGFDAADAVGSLAGGTSFSAPIFAGMLALIEQKNGTTKAGNINPTLYTLFGAAPTAFHDITAGNNQQPCTTNTVDCPAGTTYIGYVAGVGYDLVTGLGSVDLNNLAGVFPASTTVTSGGLTETATTITAPSNALITGTSETFSAAVASTAGTTIPSSGTIQFAVDGTNQGTGVALSSTGVATFAYTFTTAGSHTITATYSGASGFAASSSTFTVSAAAPASGSFTLSATNVTVTSGKTATSTVTITSASGYAGTVDFTYAASNNFTGCLFGNASQPAVANGTSTLTLTVDTLVSDCTAAGHHPLTRIAQLKTASLNGGHVPQQGPLGSRGEYPVAAAAMLAGLALIGRKRKTWPVLMVLLLAGLGTSLVLSGCGGSSNSSGAPPVTGGSGGSGTPTGTYTIRLVGTDNTTSSITASTTFTVTVD